MNKIKIILLKPIWLLVALVAFIIATFLYLTKMRFKPTIEDCLQMMAVNMLFATAWSQFKQLHHQEVEGV